MGYRHSEADKERKFKLFMRDNIELANNCGLPTSVQSERNWWYLLHHGYFELFVVEKLSEEETTAFIALVQVYFKEFDVTAVGVDPKIRQFLDPQN
jgi:hypothetical protein